MTREDVMREGGALPPGWVWTTLGEVTQPIEKVDPTQKPDSEFIYLDIASIDNSIQRITDPKRYRGAEAPSRARQLVKANDVLFSTVRTYLKNIALVPEIYDGQIASTGFSVLRGKDGVLGQYLFYYCLTDDLLSALAELQRGTSYPAVRDGDVRAQRIPLPPLPEQRRIIAEIEKQCTRLDAGVAALKRIQTNLRRYRATVLKAACEGRLAPQDPADEPADHLLARILTERRAKWEVEHPGKKYVEPAAPETDGLPELPVGWCWTRIGGVFDVPIGGTPSRSKAEYWGGDNLWVSSGEVAFNRIRSTREQITRAGLANSNAKLHPPGTVLLAMIGEGKTRGQAAILEVAATTNQNIASLLVSETQILPAWIFYWLQSRYEETRKSGSGGMQYALNSGRIKDFHCPLPPIPEQHRIVTEVERRLSVVSELEATVTTNLERAGRLRQAVLKRAFEGRLVG